MRKIVFICTALLMAAITFTSCLDDDDNTAEATVSYVGVLDSLQFTDQADTAFQMLIAEAIYSERIKLAGTNSVFSETAKVNSSSSYYASAVCDSMANDDYIKVLQNVSLYDIKDAIYTAHKDSLNGLGIGNAELVPVSPFTAYLSLYTSLQGQVLRRYTRTFR